MKLYAGVGHIGLIARLAAPLRDGEAVLDDIARVCAHSCGVALPGRSIAASIDGGTRWPPTIRTPSGAASRRPHSRPLRARRSSCPRPAPPADAARPAFTERQFRDALSEFATGVTIITHPRQPAARFVGFTANSFNSVSLDPPLVLWSLSRAANSHLAFEQCERYAINVLAADQVAARASLLAAACRPVSRASRTRWAGRDAPLIEGAVAWLECRHFSWQPIGDHTLFIGEVVRCARNRGAPLIFHHGRFRTSAPLPRRDAATS